MKRTPALYHRFGLCILRLRENGRLTQEALAQRLGVSKGAVSLWENGRVLPSLYVLYAYSRVFKGKVTFARLCDLAVEPHQGAWRDREEEETTDPTPKRGRHQHRRRHDAPNPSRRRRRTAAATRPSQGGATPVHGGDDGQG